jgi:uncharacterized surface protein with fasciclin (FAS1) repeats
MKIVKKLLPILFLALAFQSCDDDEAVVTTVETNTIVDVAVKNNLTSLVAAVTRADLATTLSGSGPFTVLAPTNEAFARFLDAGNFATLNDVPVPVLRQVLLNHVITGSLKSTDLTTGYFNTNATSAASSTPMSIYINTDSGVSFNGVSDVTIADVSADNGTVHVVNEVIGLPTVVTFAVADPNFSILEQALTRETSFSYVTTLSTANGISPAPFTVFAPTDTAFISLLSELSLNGLADVPTATLSAALNTHVVAGLNVLESGLSNGMAVPTLGGDLTVNITNDGATLTDPRGRVSVIAATDVQANNGVVHAISTVLLDE